MRPGLAAVEPHDALGDSDRLPGGTDGRTDPAVGERGRAGPGTSAPRSPAGEVAPARMRDRHRATGRARRATIVRPASVGTSHDRGERREERARVVANRPRRRRFQIVGEHELDLARPRGGPTRRPGVIHMWSMVSTSSWDGGLIGRGHGDEEPGVVAAGRPLRGDPVADVVDAGPPAASAPRRGRCRGTTASRR